MVCGSIHFPVYAGKKQVFTLFSVKAVLAWAWTYISVTGMGGFGQLGRGSMVAVEALAPKHGGILLAPRINIIIMINCKQQDNESCSAVIALWDCMQHWVCVCDTVGADRPTSGRLKQPPSEIP